MARIIPIVWMMHKRVTARSPACYSARHMESPAPTSLDACLQVPISRDMLAQVRVAAARSGQQMAPWVRALISAALANATPGI